MKERKKERRVKLGHCASLLAPSGILNELVAMRIEINKTLKEKGNLTKESF